MLYGPDVYLERFKKIVKDVNILPTVFVYVSCTVATFHSNKYIFLIAKFCLSLSRK